MNLLNHLKEADCSGKTESKTAATIGAISAIVTAMLGAGFHIWNDDDPAPRNWGGGISAWRDVHDGFFQHEHAELVVALVEDWKFTTDNEQDYSGIAVDDSDWSVVHGNDGWEEQIDSDYDGFAWLRKEVDLSGADDRPLYLVLGQIDDIDVTYFNGVQIGATGIMPAPAEVAWDSDRIYQIPADLVKGDGSDVIAIHVYDRGGAGGLVSERIGIYASDLPIPLVDLAGVWDFVVNEAAPDQMPGEDVAWSKIVAPGRWDAQGWSEFDGTAWYRCEFDLGPEAAGEMELSLGRIDDRDEVYLNGTLIGSTWREGEDQEQWNELRRYAFPSDLLRSEGNELLVKVNDVRMSGGIHAGPLGIMPADTAALYWEQRSHERSAFQKTWDWLLGRG